MTTTYGPFPPREAGYRPRRRRPSSRRPLLAVLAAAVTAYRRTRSHPTETGVHYTVRRAAL